MPNVKCVFPAAEQGTSFDETGQYELSPYVGSFMFTSLLFVRDSDTTT